MNKIIQYLDCGCAIYQDGSRTHCKSCLSSVKWSDIDASTLNMILIKHARAAEEKVAEECEEIHQAEKVVRTAILDAMREIFKIPNIKISDLRKVAKELSIKIQAGEI